jgi:hypothetical protein
MTRGMVQVRSPDSVKTDGISRACTEAIDIFDVMDDRSRKSDIWVWLKKPGRRGTKLMLDAELLLYRHSVVRGGKREKYRVGRGSGGNVAKTGNGNNRRVTL